jgi:hypothetical protein
MSDVLCVVPCDLLCLCDQIISMQGWSEILFYTQMSMGREVSEGTQKYIHTLRGHKLALTL